MFASIDIGTSSIKSALFNKEAEMLEDSLNSILHEQSFTKSGGVEEDPCVSRLGQTCAELGEEAPVHEPLEPVHDDHVRAEPALSRACRGVHASADHTCGIVRIRDREGSG